MALVGASSGTCSPGCAVTLNWQFNPITATVHTVRLPVTISTEGNSDPEDVAHHTLTVSGRGFHPSQGDSDVGATELARDDRALAGWHDAPAIPRSQLLTASSTAVRLGITQPQGVLRRLVVLRLASDIPLRFCWSVGEFSGDRASEGTLRIEPAQGDLFPGESAVCQLIFQAGCEAQLLNSEVAVMARPLTVEEIDEAADDGVPLQV